jgi:DNA-binding FrmR family transcriptional regulator
MVSGKTKRPQKKTKIDSDEKHHPHMHHDLAKTRLKRATGHLYSVIKMIDEHRPCSEILQPLSAVISALGGCRVLLLQDHLQSCLRPALKNGHEKLVDEIEMVVQRALKI